MAIAYNQRTYRCGELRAEHIDQEVTLAGWASATRDHGGVVFVDLRDHTGWSQLRFNSDVNPQAYETAQRFHHEDVIAIVGTVVSRGTQVNPNIPTGEIEVVVKELEVLSTSDPLPFQLAEAQDAAEDLRLQYRFLDFRRPEVQRIFRLRHRVARGIRNYFDERGFIEIETPFLTKSTPEGARDYLVPSRVQAGAFYALPQSPQIFKQLCMIGGFDRYAQIVRCFRDEDLRADRQPEFTQLDMEMAFVKRDEVMNMVEGCVQRVFKEAIGADIPLPLPRMTEHEAMERFGIDRPDTRYGLELQDISDLVRQVEFDPFRAALDSGGVVKCVVAKQAQQVLTRKITDGLTEDLRGIGAAGLPITKVTEENGTVQFATGVAKFLNPVCVQLCQAVKAEPGDVIFFMPGTFADVCKYLHTVRTKLAGMLDVIPPDRWDMLWIIDFPLVVWDEEEGRWFSTHHPFTAPLDEDIPLLETDPAKVRDQAYDLVLNGSEIAGGSIRIHRREVQEKVFSLLGISPEEARVKFEFLLEGLRFGPPPHGGIAFGLDRWVMEMSRVQSLREVIAFPKTQRATCPLTGAPGPVADAQLNELHLAVKYPPAEQKK